jgi:hypothetical protein
MLIAESATAISNLITGVPEIYVRFVEMLTADCRVVSIRLLLVAFLALKFLKWHCPLLFSLVISTFRNL